MEFIKATYNNGVTESVTIDRNLKALRIDIYTFIYDKDINIVLVYVGEEVLRYIGEFTTDVFDVDVCLKWIKETVNINAGKEL